MMNPEIQNDGGHAGRVTLPVRKGLDHRGPLSIDASRAWYFITICAEGHLPWVGSRVPRDRDGTDAAPLDFASIANIILSAARWYHQHGRWHLALFLVMPDHLHFIVKCSGMSDAGGHAGRVTLPGDAGGHAGRVTLPGDDRGHAGRVTLPMVSVIQQFKSYLVRVCGLSCQRGFFDTRIRDDEQYAEKFSYICHNPVRKGLCARACDWPHVIAFDPMTGEEREHRGCGDAGGVPVGVPPVGSRVPRDRDETVPVGSRVPRDRDETAPVGSRVPRDRGCTNG